MRKQMQMQRTLNGKRPHLISSKHAYGKAAPGQGSNPIVAIQQRMSLDKPLRIETDLLIGSALAVSISA